MLLSEVQTNFVLGLRSNQDAINYLRDSRNISSFTVDDLGIGYCGFDSTDYIGINLYNRITFAIKDYNGEIIGFGGRTLDNKYVKYINSPASPIYDKSRALFNIDNARDYILESGVAIVVEGYMDVTSLWDKGIKNCVATCGTSMTRKQLRMLKMFADKVYIMYDGDSAGENASEKTIRNLLIENHPLYKITIPFGFDPDEYVNISGKEGILELINNAEKIQ